ncbi:Nod factor export ATP-binding protein I [Gottschalkia purinilytica]|uniref:Nod factor export ATP-binding protein I n=1 Tax=Gottschalkia purinilytica TaxID=1503 RepID=A0A0L0WA45_GOTPU|nr:ABC transporter ATP-binding protein [Gottschalkia purinilytica]KNF08307.1 Nod factor export ATP-binding protein I [Gottschalkia purinilytica]
MEAMICVENINKSYKDNKVLKNISFDVNKGEILCFLGPNGAGKSTMINILSTALDYDNGEIRFYGRKVRKNDRDFKKNLGIVPQDLAIYEDISAEENVKFFTSLYGIKGKALNENVEKALDFVGLLDRRKDKPKTFSGGMKRRLNIACAIAHNPKIIIMDEPTVGIDPQSRNHILNSIKMLRDKGATIIYTTHYMEEVEEISTRIIVIDHGEIIAEGTKEKLKEKFDNEKIYYIEINNVEDLNKDEFFHIEGIKDVSIQNGSIKVSTLRGIENLDKLIAFIMKKGLKINNLITETPSLETVFLELTGRTLRD